MIQIGKRNDTNITTKLFVVSTFWLTAVENRRLQKILEPMWASSEGFVAFNNYHLIMYVVLDVLVN